MSRFLIRRFSLLIVMFLIFGLFFGLLFSAQAHGTEQEHVAEETEAVIYYNEACGMCSLYINNEIKEMLGRYGIADFIKKDYINDKSNRPEMNQLMARLGVPLPLQSHIMTFVGDKYVLGGHVPQHIIDEIFDETNSQRFKRIIIYQDEMHNDAENYQIWAIPEYANDFVGIAKTYPIDTPITEYLNYLEQNKSQLLAEDNYGWIKEKSLLPTVLISGFLDGLNPCAFAVLLLFIAFLFSIKRGKADVMKMGSIYIIAIYLAYLLIGFGLLKALLFTNSPH